MATRKHSPRKTPTWRDRAAEIGRRIVGALRGPTPVPVRVQSARRRAFFESR